MAGAGIEVTGLVVRRGDRTVLDGLDLAVGPGVTGLLGPSGCGKSTLLRAIVGVQRTHGGSVTVLGHPAGAGALPAFQRATVVLAVIAFAAALIDLLLIPARRRDQAAPAPVQGRE